MHEESFEESALFEYFNTTRFLLSIWKKEIIDGEVHCRFLGADFWGMNGKDINGPLKNVGKKQKKIMKGVKLIPIMDSDGKLKKSQTTFPKWVIQNQ